MFSSHSSRFYAVHGGSNTLLAAKRHKRILCWVLVTHDLCVVILVLLDGSAPLH
jgi:hypothetical protein